MARDAESKTHPARQEAGYEVPIRGSHVSAYFCGYSDFMTD